VSTVWEITMTKRNDKALLLNVSKNTITEVVIKDYTDIAKFGKFDMFTTVQVNAEGDTLYVDDEGLINGTEVGFTFEGYDGPLMGNAVLLGCDRRTGDSKDVTMTVAEFASKVKTLMRVGPMFAINRATPEIVA
jgi:hypothetical protein